MNCEYHRFESKKKGAKCVGCNAKRPTPKLIDISTLAKSIGWSSVRVRRVLLKAGLADKVGSKWYTTRARILSIYPEMAAFL